LTLLDEVQRTGETLVITKKGKPVAEVAPHKPPKQSPIGIWKGRTEILGDIAAPIDVEWEALK
jgi:antitoxin (DNA-binding transcriptional repressor) of toxin-antitoxin stability system